MSRVLPVILTLLLGNAAGAAELPSSLLHSDAEADCLSLDRVQVLERIVRLLLAQGKTEDARRRLEPEVKRITEDTPKGVASVADIRLLYLAGIVEELAGAPGRRDEFFKQARVLAPTDAFTHLLLGKAFEALHREDIAEAEFTRVLELAPEGSVHAMEAVESLAQSAYTNHRYGRAAELFARLLAMLRETTRLEIAEEALAQFEYLELVSRGFALLEGDGRDALPSALETCERAWKLEPRRIDAPILGERIAARWIPMESGRADELRKTWRTRSEKLKDSLRSAITASPRDTNGYNALAWFLAELDRDHDEGIRAARRALELRPADPAFLDTLAELQFKKGDVPGAIKTIRQVIDVYPFASGYYRHQLERFEAALRTPKARSPNAIMESPNAISRVWGPRVWGSTGAP